MLGIVALAICGAAVLGQRLYRSEKVNTLERQLALAQADRNDLAVREVARRLARIDSSPERQLRVAEVFLAVKSMKEFWAMLERLECGSPKWRASAVHLRARGYLAVENWVACITTLKSLLAYPELSVAERTEGWGELAAVQAWLGEWSNALVSTDARIRISDTTEARLEQARALVRLRRWQEAGVAFARLKQTASDNPRVKDFLPRWERVERALDQLRGCDEAVLAVPVALKPRVERAFVEAQMGLWQNAVEDLNFVALGSTVLRFPLLLGSHLGLRERAQDRAPDTDEGRRMANISWLASSGELARLNGVLGRNADDWRALLDIDFEIVGSRAGWSSPTEHAARLARQAQLEFQLGAHSWARADASEILKQVPGFLPAEAVEIAASLEDGDPINAGRDLESALKEHTDEMGKVPSELMRLAAKVYQARGQHSAAVEALSACLAESRTVELLQARAKSLRFMQRFGEADQDLAEAQTLSVATQVEGKP